MWDRLVKRYDLRGRFSAVEWVDHQMSLGAVVDIVEIVIERLMGVIMIKRYFN